MLIAAIAQTQITQAQWMNIGIGFAIFIGVILLLRAYINSHNKMMINGVLFIAFVLVFTKWVAYRDEPKILSPIVESISNFMNPAKVHANIEKQKT